MESQDEDDGRAYNPYSGMEKSAVMQEVSSSSYKITVSPPPNHAAILMSPLDRHLPGLVVRTAAITTCPPIKSALRWPEPMAPRTKGLRH